MNNQQLKNNKYKQFKTICLISCITIIISMILLIIWEVNFIQKSTLVEGKIIKLEELNNMESSTTKGKVTTIIIQEKEFEESSYLYEDKNIGDKVQVLLSPDKNKIIGNSFMEKYIYSLIGSFIIFLTIPFLNMAKKY